MEMNFSFDVVKPERLLLHEEVDEGKVALFKERVREEGVRDPVVVDRRSLLVLDGAHRVKALSALNALVPVQLVDYFSDSVSLKFWYPKPRALPQGTPSTKRQVLAFLSSNRAVLGWKAGRRWYFLPSPYSALSSLFSLQKRLLKGAEFCARLEQGCVMRREFSKKEILRMAKKGILLPIKYTRHLVKGRVLGINMPLNALFSKKDALNFLKQRLEESEKRFYEESVWVLY